MFIKDNLNINRMPIRNIPTLPDLTLYKVTDIATLYNSNSSSNYLEKKCLNYYLAPI